GAVWWSLERRYGLPIMPVSLAFLRGGDLGKVDAIVIPDASAGALATRLGKDGADRLRRWVRDGGTLVTMGGATAWAAREDVNLTSARRVGAPDSTAAPDADRDTLAARHGPAADTLLAVTSPGANHDAPERVPGAHFDVVLDRAHWLTFGYDAPRVTVLVDGDTFLGLSRNGTNVAVFPPTGPIHRAGFIWPGNTERLLRNTVLLIHEPLGRGHVVLFANDPMFRGWWRALDRMVLNALVLGGTM
ncbi:MAG TPA: hypothetical protein VFY16_04265, partial [Gemmatimonadaceae bacterium]|nr:hypothetical protein [Gemmatimonadaceae bacterium]